MVGSQSPCFLPNVAPRFKFHPSCFEGDEPLAAGSATILLRLTCTLLPAVHGRTSSRAGLRPTGACFTALCPWRVKMPSFTFRPQEAREGGQT
jgi:hypothetical protein